MYRFRELLHIYLAALAGVIMFIVGFFLPPVPVHTTVIRLIMIITLALVLGIILRYYIDSLIPVEEEPIEEEEEPLLDLYIEGDQENKDPDYTRESNNEEETKENDGNDENSVSPKGIEKDHLEQSNEYLDEDFLDELEEEY